MSKQPAPTWRQRIGRLLGNRPDAGPVHADFKFFQTKGEVEFVFKSGGVDYYKFVNEQHIPALRAFAAKDVWAELSYKMDDRHLDAALASAMSLLNQGKGVHAGVILQTLRDRIGYITHVDLLYKLASVIYLDPSENPLDWDPIYNERKTTAWKKDETLDRFFLQTRMINYLPFGDLSKIDFQSFTNAQRKGDLSHLKTLSSILSGDKEAEELSTFLTSQTEILTSLIHTATGES